MEWQSGTHSGVVYSGIRVLVGNPDLSKTTEAVPHPSTQTREWAPDSCKVEITERGDNISVHSRRTRNLAEWSHAKSNYSELLRTDLVSKVIWNRLEDCD